MTQKDYDLFVIGGGSGGVRAARLAGQLGKRVGIAEADRFGGTCVIRGCVPKKLLVYASKFSHEFEDAAGYGWTVPPARFDWPSLIANKDREIGRLERIYMGGLSAAGVDLHTCRAMLAGPDVVWLEEGDRTVTADQILIATGGVANRLETLDGHEHCIVSDDAFELPQLPKSIIIKGGGYIAVEFAGIFAGLGCETTLVYRGDHILRGFDHDLSHSLDRAMRDNGIRVVLERHFKKVERMETGRTVTLDNGERIEAETVMLAVGRLPNTRTLGLEEAGVETDRLGAIVVNEKSQTNVDNIHAVGDVTNRVNLTPVAIHEAMCLIDTLYRDTPRNPDHEMIATAVFSQPEIGTVGLSEEAAAREFASLDIYRAEFRPMKHTLSGRDEKTMMKIVVDPKSDAVLGVHMFGPDAGEMAQLLGISLKMGATKADFDRTMAVHPTAAEELVTMYQPSYCIKDGKRVDA